MAGAVPTYQIEAMRNIFRKKLHLTFVQDRGLSMAAPEGAPRILGLSAEVQLDVVEHTNSKHSFNLRKVSTSQTVAACRATSRGLSFERLSRTQMTSGQTSGEMLGEGKTVLQFALSEYGRLDRGTSSCRNRTHQASQAVRTMRHPDYYTAVVPASELDAESP